jgi:predicted RNA-binding protein YlqC (UPF0109 family)
MVDETSLRSFEELISNIVVGVVNRPEEVAVVCTEDEHGVLATINVSPSDVGFVLGKKGATITAIRTLCRGFGAKRHCRLSVKVYDPNPKQYAGIQSTLE